MFLKRLFFFGKTQPLNYTQSLNLHIQTHDGYFLMLLTTHSTEATGDRQEKFSRQSLFAYRKLEARCDRGRNTNTIKEIGQVTRCELQANSYVIVEMVIAKKSYINNNYIFFIQNDYNNYPIWNRLTDCRKVFNSLYILSLLVIFFCIYSKIMCSKCKKKQNVSNIVQG